MQDIFMQEKAFLLSVKLAFTPFNNSSNQMSLCSRLDSLLHNRILFKKRKRKKKALLLF